MVDTSEIFYIYNRIKQLVDINILSNSLIISELLQKIFTNIANLQIHDIDFKTPQWIIDVEHYISQNLTTDISLDDLARISNYSAYHFARSFKRYTGFSPYEYIILARINYAKNLLVTTDCSINEISRMINFSSCSRFIEKFKIINAITPLQYKNSNQKYYGQIE